ncbi:MAG TPA: DoxX family membrane protein [Pseudonocardiaceae bacterium]|nr:DoxX family membrane protein [Pseudonocardiaceae bacterium]
MEIAPETAAPNTVAPNTIVTPGMVRLVVALRIFFGLNWLSNAIAKVFNKANFDWGWLSFNLVNRNTAHAILVQGTGSTGIAPLRAFYLDVVLPNWGFFQIFLTIAELGVGLGLLFGIATRLAALGGLLLLVPVWLMLFHTNQYFWTYPLDLFPLVLLALVPAGRVAGVDGKFLTKIVGERWPF